MQICRSGNQIRSIEHNWLLSLDRSSPDVQAQFKRHMPFPSLSLQSPVHFESRTEAPAPTVATAKVPNCRGGGGGKWWREELDRTETTKKNNLTERRIGGKVETVKVPFQLDFHEVYHHSGQVTSGNFLWYLLRCQSLVVHNKIDAMKKHFKWRLEMAQSHTHAQQPKEGITNETSLFLRSNDHR